MNKAIPFVIGVAAGSVATWLITKTYYKRIADEEIESVIQRFKNRDITTAGLSQVEPTTETESVTTTATYENTTSYTMDQEEYNKLLEQNGYSVPTEYEEYTPSDDDCSVYVGPDDEVVPPFVISPEDYGEAGYEAKSWLYYADFVLTDEKGEIVSDPESIIGDALSHFGDYGEDDSVYVRNAETECDYEILKHEQTFSAANGEDY